MKRKNVLAQGEMTGHAHVLEGDIDVEVQDDGVCEFSIPHKTVVKHEEHKPIALPKGRYRSDVVRETDPFEGERRVVD